MAKFFTILASCLLLCRLCSGAGLPKSSFFVANEGQWEGAFAFRYEGLGAMWYITPQGVTVDFRQYEDAPRRGMLESWLRREETEPARVQGHVVKMSYADANPSWEIVGEDRLPHYSNYFYGPDSCRWRSRVGHYQRVTAKNVWPGVDVEYRIAPEGIESVYHLAAGVDPAVIRIRYVGLDAPLRTDSQGNLVLRTSLGEVREKAPMAWQVWQDNREEVGIAFQVTDFGECRLWCPGYDRQLPLTIDPLLYGGMLGGGWGRDDIWDICIASDESIVVGGHTDSNDFPVTPGAYQDHRHVLDGFVTKLTADGDSLLLSTYLGQAGETNVRAVCATSDGSVWACGNVNTPFWPLTAGAFDSVFAGPNEGFLIHLSADGTTLLFSSFLGGDSHDVPWDIQIDATRGLCVVGETASGFPVTPNALFPTPSSNQWLSSFLAVIDPSTAQLVYSSYLTGNDNVEAIRCRVASPGRLWMWGITEATDLPVTANALQQENNTDSSLSYANEGFFLLWNLNENRLDYSSYFGSRGYDAIIDLWIWDSSRLVLGGGTDCPEFPLTPGAFDTVLLGGASPRECFVTVVRLPDTIVASTLLGGDYSVEYLSGVSADSRGILAVGETYSYDFPVTPDAFSPLLNQNGSPSYVYGDAFAVRLDTALSRMEYGTFLGGWHVEYVWSTCFVSPDRVWIAGESGSSDFPFTPDAYQTSYHDYGDGFMLEFEVPDPSSVPPSIHPQPDEFRLSVYPNPFNSRTVIRYSLPHQAHVDLEVFDILGRVVSRADLGNVSAGSYSRSLDFGAHASGTYLVRLRTADHMTTTKILCVR